MRLIKPALTAVKEKIWATEAWTFFASMFCFSLLVTMSEPVSGWGIYWKCFLGLSVVYAPVLLFQVYRQVLSQRLSEWNYRLVWLAVFVAYLGLVAGILNGRTKHTFTAYQFGLGWAVSMTLLAIECTKKMGGFTQQFHLKMNWLQRMSIENAVLITLLLIAILWGVMAASDLALFNSQQLIRWQVKPLIVLKNFGAFMAITAQFFAAYLCIYFFYYLNHSFLVPRLLKEKGVLQYLIGLLGGVAFFYPILAQLVLLLPLSQLFSMLPSENYEVFDKVNGETALAVMVLSIPLILATQWFRQNNKIVLLERQQVQAEVDLLKQQLDPHFFFNTLNNLYALSRRKSEQTPEVILQLSDLMRYVIYKGKEEKIPLALELKYLEDYVQLQCIRLHKKLEFSFIKNHHDLTLLVPPLLFVILVENAFKHGVEPSEGKAFLELFIETNAQNLTFICRNSFELRESNGSGIGLANLSRRLQLLLPGKHSLKVQEKDNVYEATLQLQLS